MSTRDRSNSKTTSPAEPTAEELEARGESAGGDRGRDEQDAPAGGPDAGAGPSAADDAPSGGGAAESELAEMRDRWLRARADLENARRRSRLDVEEARRFGSTPLVQDLLGVLDDLQRALAAVPAGEAAAEEAPTALASLVEGLRMTEQSFLRVLENHGVSAVPTRPGDPFDPAVHRAIVQQPTDAHPPGTVVAEIVRGYRLHDRLLREAQVAVASPPPEAEDTDADV